MRASTLETSAEIMGYLSHLKRPADQTIGGDDSIRYIFNGEGKSLTIFCEGSNVALRMVNGSLVSENIYNLSHPELFDKLSTALEFVKS